MEPDEFDFEPRPERCGTCGYCTVEKMRLFASRETYTRYICERTSEYVHETQETARCNYWKGLE